MHYCVHAEMHPEIQSLRPSDPQLRDTPLATAHKEVLELLNKNPLFASVLGEGRTKNEYRSFIATGEEWSLISDPSAPIKHTLPQAWALLEGGLFQLETIERHLSKR
jgi:hypothetical protein